MILLVLKLKRLFLLENRQCLKIFKINQTGTATFYRLARMWRIIMGSDQSALLRLWREKRGELRPEDLSGNLIVQLGTVTEDLKFRRWYETTTGEVITDIQHRMFHQALPWMAATLDGRVVSSGAVFELKYMLPWSFSEEAAAQKYMPQLQHNMWVVAAKFSRSSRSLPGAENGSRSKTQADPLYQHLIVTAERKFWRCVESGDTTSSLRRWIRRSLA